MLKQLRVLSFASAFLFYVPSAIAQDGSYAPPPMFDDLSPPMVRPQTSTGNIVERKSSPDTVLPPDAPDARPVITPRVSPVPDSAASGTVTRAPVPAQPVVRPVVPTAPAAPKKMQPIIDPRDSKRPAAAKPVTKKMQTPAAPVTKPAAKPSAPAAVSPAVVPPAPVAVPAPAPKTIAPAKRDPAMSAIQGPKTMPALPTEEVHIQETFQPQPEKVEETILERSQKAANEKAKDEAKRESAALAPVPVLPDVAPASFDTSGQGALKRSIAFAQGQVGLSSAEIDPVAVAVTQELGLSGKEEWRVQIRAYASTYGTGVNSDKRIALSRALSLRTALVEHGVAASRIDVLAEGVQSAGTGSADRIDLYLYGPAVE